jgi:hypothetical protein
MDDFEAVAIVVKCSKLSHASAPLT